MRDLLVVLVVFASLAAAVRYPFVGILVWAWFSLITPHLMAFGVFGIPLNAAIAAVTMGSLVLHREFGKMRFTPITGLLIAFACLLWLSQQFSLKPDVSAEYFDRFFKTLIFVILVSLTATTKLRINALVWMLVLSIGYFGAKGALFTVLTLGEYRVQGVTEAILEDNNHMGIALVSILPMILYLRGEAVRPVVRHGLLALAGLCIFSVLGTHSRGAFLSLIAFGGFFWLQSKHKVSIMAVLMLATLPAIAFLPSKWGERMTSIGSATQDESFMGRVMSWQNNFDLAVQNPLTGAGLRVAYEPDVLASAIGHDRAETALAAHSIYFEILGGAGFLALGVYLGIFATAFFTARSMAASLKQSSGHFRGGAKAREHAAWAGRFGYFAQISLVAFGLGGASVSLEMWDGYWIVLALVGAAAAAPMSANVGQPVPAEKRAEAPRRWRAAARAGGV